MALSSATSKSEIREAFSGESSGIDSGANETNLESFNSAVDCISGHQLREIVFSGFLKRVDAHLSLLSDLYLSSESHLAALKWLVGASDILWRLFRESTPSSQEKLSCCVGNDLNFITLTLRVLCATLQLSDSPRKAIHLSVCTTLINLLHNSIPYQLKIVTLAHKSDQLLKIIKILRDLSDKAQTDSVENCITSTLLMLYLCAGSTSICQYFKANRCVQSIGAFTQSPNVRIQLITKSLIARLIPLDTDSHEMAILILINDEEVNQMITILQSQSDDILESTVFSMVLDLSRSPHNMWAFVSRGITSILTNAMDSSCERSQALAAKLMWTVMELENDSPYDSVDLNAIVNNGSLQNEGQQIVHTCEELIGNDDTTAVINFCGDLLSFIAEHTVSIKKLQTAVADTDVFVALMFLSKLMDQADYVTQREITNEVGKTSGIYSAWKSMFDLVTHKDVQSLKKKSGHDPSMLLLSCLTRYTCQNEDVCAGLSRIGIIENLGNILEAGQQAGVLSEDDQLLLHLTLKILMSCASDSYNLPAYNYAYSRSRIILSLLHFVHGQNSSLALLSKMVLALLSPLLNADQLHALMLTQAESRACVTILVEAAKSPNFTTAGCTLLTTLKILIWFTHQYYKQSSNQIDSVSDFVKQLSHASDNLKSNVHLLVECGIMSAIEAILTQVESTSIQLAATRLVWSLAHTVGSDPIKQAFSGIVEGLKSLRETTSPELQQAVRCTLWILGFQSNDYVQGSLMYAQGCLKYENCLECIEVCDSFIIPKQNTPMIQAFKLLKGKAMFFEYKRKYQYVLAKPHIKATLEGRKILSECFYSIQQCIGLLGTALDWNILDEEGSKLLDWAMIDHLSAEMDGFGAEFENQRCILCRERKSLQSSHIWPEFILKASKLSKLTSKVQSDYIFGVNKLKLKSVGQCTIKMLCKDCEQILSQNGENQFKQNFTEEINSGELKYSSWLFNFCIGMIFRCLVASYRFPTAFNDDKIYDTILLCRKHLLLLPFKANKKIITPSDRKTRLLTKLEHQLINEKLHIYLYISPLEVPINFGVYDIPYPEGAFALSRFKEADGTTNICGYVHFLLLCCGPITLVVPFKESQGDVLNKGFHLTFDSEKSDQIYTIQSHDKCIELLPKGVWSSIRSLSEESRNTTSEVVRLLPQKYAAKLESSREVVQIPSEGSVEISALTDSKSITLLTLLPGGYEIINPGTKLPHSQRIKLPSGHQIILHTELSLVKPNDIFTIFLCINSLCRFYMIFLQHMRDDHVVFADGAYLEFDNDKPILTAFLLNNPVVAYIRKTSLSKWQQVLSTRLLHELLPRNHFDSIQLFVNLVKYRRSIGRSWTQFLPSLDQKCSLSGCWYCSDLCHNCMQPATIMYSGVHMDSTLLKFCSEACKGLWFFEPQSQPFHVSSFLEECDQSVQPHLLHILTGTGSSVQLIHLCIRDDNLKINRPFVTWHIKGSTTQTFSHFVISKDCTPLKYVWPSQFSNAEIEYVHDLIIQGKGNIKCEFSTYFQRAVKLCSPFENLESFLCSTYNGRSQDQENAQAKEADTITSFQSPVQSYLPSEFIFCNPQMGLGNSFPIPIGHKYLLHHVEMEESLHTTYILAMTTKDKLYLISIKHHQEENWYFVDGVYLSADGSCATAFMQDASYTRRNYTISDMNTLITRILPVILRTKGIPSIHPTNFLIQYHWVDVLSARFDMKCYLNCWYCEHNCLCCMFKKTLHNVSSWAFCNQSCYCNNILITETKPATLEFCSQKCHDLLRLKPDTVPILRLSKHQLQGILGIKDPLVIATVTKVLSTDISMNTIVRIYMCKTSDHLKGISTTHCQHYIIIQFRTAYSQVVLDFFVTPNYLPLEPVWFSEYTKQMIERHRVYLYCLINLLFGQVPIISDDIMVTTYEEPIID